MPILYAILGGFRDTGQLSTNPVALPDPWVFSNYTGILKSSTFWHQVWNSTLIALVSTALTVPVAALAAFVFARFAFRGREVFYTIFTLGLLFPVAIAILPIFIMVRNLGLLDNPLGVALPQAAFGLPMTIIILRPFFHSIPSDLQDAAAIDGCGPFRFFVRILLPLSRPVLATVSVLAIVGSWNAFLLPLVVLDRLERLDAAPGRHQLLPAVHDRHRQGPGLHDAVDGARADLLRVRRAPAHPGPDHRGGQGLSVAAPPYLDPALAVADRVDDLLGRMTLEEKLAQLGSIWVFEVLDGDRVEPGKAQERLGAGIGQITRVAGATSFEMPVVAALANEIQRFLVEETRLGIPAIVHEECLHGLVARDAVCFPQSIGLAAAWDPELVEALASSFARQLRAMGAHQGLAPIFDVARDPRWGRIEETYGEDPYLIAALGVAYVRGLQEGAGAPVLATGKHMVGHGLPEGGMNRAPAHIGPRELRDVYLWPFEAAVREAGMRSMMHAYEDVDGVPCVASRELFTTTLRDEWGFDGIVVSDYAGIDELVESHAIVGDLAAAAALALEAGIDVELPSTAAFGAPLAQALADGASTRRSSTARSRGSWPSSSSSACSRRPTSTRLPRARRSRPTAPWRATRRAPRSCCWRTTGRCPLRDDLRDDRGHRAQRRQRAQPAGRLRPRRAHRDAARDARQPDRLPGPRRPQPVRRARGPLDDPRRDPRALRAAAPRSASRRAATSSTRATPRSRRRSTPRAERTSRSSSSASARG